MSIAYVCQSGAGYDGPTGAGTISGAVAAGAPGIGGPGTNGAAALGGSVLLVSASPLPWLRSRRKRKRR